MCVSLAPSFSPIKAPGTASVGLPLLDEAGAQIVLRWTPCDLAAPIAPSPSTLLGPRGVCLHPDGSLWVCDTGHRRLLRWRRTPEVDNVPADLTVGQTDFSREGRSATAAPSGASLNVPTGVCAFCRHGLAVADAWNHRVLLWRAAPSRDNQSSDIVLGQDDAAQTLANRGSDRPNAATLHWPYGVAEIDGRRVVADTGNRRALIWNEPQATGQRADIVLGQSDFDSRDENAGDAVNAFGMRWPRGLALWRAVLAVSDAGDNRIMLWKDMPDRSGAPCDLVLGQKDFSGCDHNMAAYYPSAPTLNMPYAIAVARGRLIAADTASSRLIAFSQAEMGARADRRSGQRDFASKGDNGWGVARRDSLCWPYGLSVRDELVAIADSGNNRVMLWPLAKASR
jgi:hypothetical protein